MPSVLDTVIWGLSLLNRSPLACFCYDFGDCPAWRLCLRHMHFTFIQGLSLRNPTPCLCHDFCSSRQHDDSVYFRYTSLLYGIICHVMTLPPCLCHDFGDHPHPALLYLQGSMASRQLDVRCTSLLYGVCHFVTPPVFVMTLVMILVWP